MLRSCKELFGYEVLAQDGQIGEVHDFLFEDREWAIRYLVVDTGPWILGRKILLSVSALGQPDWSGQQFPVALTREKVKASPEVDADKDVSRRQEIKLHDHYAWPMYWDEPGGVERPVPQSPPSPTEVQEEEKVTRDTGEKTAISRSEYGDPHLRSMRDVRKYNIVARDGKIGQADDFVVATEDWVLRYLVVDTGTWLPGRKVLIALDWIEAIRYESSEIGIDLSRETIKKSPEFDPEEPVNREYEGQLYDYYGRPRYWDQERGNHS